LAGRRVWWTQRFAYGLAGRLGGPSAGEPPTPGALWIHAVSVGEAAVGSALASRLPATTSILVTTVTPTGQARARSGLAALGARGRVAYLPFDLGWPISRFLRRNEPAALLLVEGDYWPLLLATLKRRSVPVAVVNGRFSDRSFPRLLRLRALVRRALLDPVDRFAVQSEVDRERLLALGVAGERIVVTGNLKFDLPEPPELPALAARLERLADGRPILLAGSTMPGEEEAVLDAFAAAGGGDRALLVLAPRHPERFAAVAAMATERIAAIVLRSGEDRPRPALFLLDSIGELAAIYRSAHAAFIGGTLVATGGHNPIEAARFGVPVAVGPSMENFRDIAARFDEEGAWARVADAGALARIWSDWLERPAAATAIGARGRRLVETNRGATEKTLAFLAPLLEHGTSRATRASDG